MLSQHSKRLVPSGKVTIYRTTKRVENPRGDGRHNRADWRSQLDKTIINAGFMFGVDEAGNLFDYSVPAFGVVAKDAATLREAMLSVASAPLEAPVEAEETVESVLATIPGGAAEAVTRILTSLEISPKELRGLLQEKPKEETATAATKTISSTDVTAAL